MPFDTTSNPFEPRLRLGLILPSGEHHMAPAATGFRVLDLIRAHGLPIKAECGGAGVCATCHVRVALEWAGQLPAPSQDELARLDEIPGADDRSRLACQIAMTEELDGLEIELQADSLSVVDRAHGG